MSGASLRMLLQMGYQRFNNNGLPNGQLQILGGPNWIDSDRYDLQAKPDCSGGVISREQMQLMIQSMLEDRFVLKAHFETRELPIYNLVVAKDSAKIKSPADPTPPAISLGRAQLCGPAPDFPPMPPLPLAGQRGGPFDSGAPMPRGSMMMSRNQTGLAMQATAVPLTNL